MHLLKNWTKSQQLGTWEALGLTAFRIVFNCFRLSITSFADLNIPMKFREPQTVMTNSALSLVPIGKLKWRGEQQQLLRAASSTYARTRAADRNRQPDTGATVETSRDSSKDSSTPSQLQISKSLMLKHSDKECSWILMNFMWTNLFGIKTTSSFLNFVDYFPNSFAVQVASHCSPCSNRIVYIDRSLCMKFIVWTLSDAFLLLLISCWVCRGQMSSDYATSSSVSAASEANGNVNFSATNHDSSSRNRSL